MGSTKIIDGNPISDADPLAVQSSAADPGNVALGTAADTTSSNTVIGLLKKLISLWPTALGQAAAASSVPVVLASDQGAIVLVTTTIVDATSLSPGVDLAGRALVGIVTPAGWTTAVMTFQVSPDNSTWFEYEDVNGTAIQIPSTAASKYRALDPADFIGVRYLKVRSGTSAAAVSQSSGDIVTMVTRSVL